MRQPSGAPSARGPELGDVDFANRAWLGGHPSRDVDRLPHEGLNVGRKIAENMGDPTPENPIPLRAQRSREGSLVHELRRLQQPLPRVPADAGSVPLGGLVCHDLLNIDVRVGALRRAS